MPAVYHSEASSTILGIEMPGNFQYVGAHHLTLANGTYLVVNHRTADGETLVTTLLILLWCGVGIYLVPLVDLGSDQVERITTLLGACAQISSAVH